MKKVSLILPATDETRSLEETVRRAREKLAAHDLEFVIVTHPKLTTPECRAAIHRLSANAHIKAFDQTRPGLGGAFRDAFERAAGEFVVMMASDLETDPDALPVMLARMEEGYDVVTTTRWKRGAGFQGYNPVKLVLNLCFQTFFRVLYMTRLSDLTYAYRAYRAEVLRSIRWEEDKFPFLFESLLKPLRLGYRITEVEAPWRARTEGVSHNSWRQTFDYTRVGLRLRFLPKSRFLY